MTAQHTTALQIQEPYNTNHYTAKMTNQDLVFYQ